MTWLWSGGAQALTKRFRIEWHSPVCPSLLEVDADESNVRSINPIVRFASIFEPLRKDSTAFGGDDRRVLEDALLHILAYLDRRSGIDRASITIDRHERALLDGRYGQRAQALFMECNASERREIARLLTRQEESGRLLFDEALAAFFPAALSYDEWEEERILLCLPQEKNEHDRNFLELLELLFLDRTAVVQSYWAVPFGILGEPWTMRLDHFKLHGPLPVEDDQKG